MKTTLPALHKDKNTNTAIYAAIVIVILFAIYKVYQKVQGNKQVDPALEVSTSTGPTPSTTPTAPTYNNNTVFSVKSPYMKSDRVQWIQNAYNKYAKNRKLFGKTPDWAIISEDGVYGNNTANAMNRLMGKKSVNWSEVKTRTDYLQGQLTNSNFNYQ